LIKRLLGIDADRCDACAARMKLRAFLTLPASIERFASCGLNCWRLSRLKPASETWRLFALFR
jgi:hypothetical protein